MSAFGGLYLTSRGKMLQTKAQTGAALQYTRIAVGDGELGTGSILELNNLIHEVKSLTINKLKVLGEGRAVVGAVLTNQDLTEGFYFREIGVFANDPDVGEVLYCYGNAGDLAEYIPASEADIIEKNIDVQTLIGNATNVTVEINESLVYETVQGAQEKADTAESNANSYTDSEILTLTTHINNQLENKVDKTNLSTVATTGSYNDLINKPTLGTAASKNTGTASGNVPVIGPDGKLESSILPALAITDTFVVNSQSAMLSLIAQVGDVCVRTDENKSYILKSEPATILENWQQLLSPPNEVLSVNGKTGTVILNKNDVGLGNVENYSVATKEEAEEGTSPTKYMTPERTKQAIDKNLAPLEKQVNEHLAEMVYKLKSNGVDDTQTLQNAIDSYGVIEVVDDLKISGEININKPTKLYSLSMKTLDLISNENIEHIFNVLSGDILIAGLKIKCNQKSNTAIRVREGYDNIDILRNEISDCKQNIPTSEAVAIKVCVENSNNVNILNNVIMNMEGVTNGVEADIEGTARGINVWADDGYCKNVNISGNIIKNIFPYEDADAIAVMTTTSFVADIVINRNKIENAKKRGVKVQPCLGVVTIDENEIIQTDLTQKMYSAISCYNQTARINNNKIDVQYGWYGIDFEPQINNNKAYMFNNEIKMSNTSLIDGTNTRGVNLGGLADFVKIKDNIFEGAYAGVFVRKDIDVIDVENNDFKNTIYANVVFLCGESNVKEVQTILFNSNILSGNAGIFFISGSNATVNTIIALGNSGATNWNTVVDLSIPRPSNIQIFGSGSTDIGGDLWFGDIGKGLVLSDSVNGNRYRVKISDGELVVEPL